MSSRVAYSFHGFIRKLIAAGLALGVLSSCAYQLGRPPRKLPGGYTQVTVPVFKNLTLEPGIEMAATSALISEFERSRVVQTVKPEMAEVVIEGEVTSLTLEPKAPQAYTPGSRQPLGTVIAADYRMVLEMRVVLRKASDKSILWQSNFSAERTYSAPRILQGGLNTANPLYNQSARRQNIESLSSLLMSEAHDRMTENF